MMYGSIRRARDRAWKRARSAFRQAKRGNLGAGVQGAALMARAARLNALMQGEGGH